MQGDTGHAQATMVTNRYAHVMDDDRRLNAEKFEEVFYGGKTKESPQTDQQNTDVSVETLELVKALGNSPELMALLKGLINQQK